MYLNCAKEKNKINLRECKASKPNKFTDVNFYIWPRNHKDFLAFNFVKQTENGKLFIAKTQALFYNRNT